MENLAAATSIGTFTSAETCFGEIVGELRSSKGLDMDMSDLQKKLQISCRAIGTFFGTIELERDRFQSPGLRGTLRAGTTTPSYFRKMSGGVGSPSM